MKRLIQICFMLPALPLWLWWRLWTPLIGADRAFMGPSQLCALCPGTVGEYLRAAFYRLALHRASQDVSVGFLTVFTNPRADIGKYVSIGPSCNIGWAKIGDHCLISAMTCVTSGKKQHGYSRTDIPMHMQKGRKTMVTIGRDCWIGASCVVMADVGEGSIVAAGSVVSSPIPPFSIAAGNPAKVIRQRESDTEKPSGASALVSAGGAA